LCPPIDSPDRKLKVVHTNIGTLYDDDAGVITGNMSCRQTAVYAFGSNPPDLENPGWRLPKFRSR